MQHILSELTLIIPTKNDHNNIIDNFVTEGFSFDIEIILLALKNKIDITEIPVKYIHDLNSNIHIFSDSVKMLKQLIKLKNQKLEMFE